jgi:hypothetical protein
MNLAERISAAVQKVVQEILNQEFGHSTPALISTPAPAPVSSTKKRGRRPGKATKCGAIVGQRWKGKLPCNKGRTIEIVSLDKDHIIPKMIVGGHASRRIKYENLKSHYELIP